MMLARLLTTTVVALIALTEAAHACPSCKQGLSEFARWAMGFNASILFMMSMPFTLALLVGGGFYVAHRRNKEKERRTSEP